LFVHHLQWLKGSRTSSPGSNTPHRAHNEADLPKKAKNKNPFKVPSGEELVELQEEKKEQKVSINHTANR
jgi:hypothetical protein